MSALILTYHGVEDAPGPLFVSPELFEQHLDVVLEWGGDVLTVGELAAALRERRLPERALSITFDDGFASVARAAVPLLLERGLAATVFCVAGYVGRNNDWPSQPAGIPRRPLATREELAELARAGFEIGAHGFEHAPLVTSDEDALRLEIVESRADLECMTGAEVHSFAHPYGAEPSEQAQELIAATYAAACTTELRPVTAGADPLAVPRIDAHYLRYPQLLRRALDGRLQKYLRSRSYGARVRRYLSPGPPR